MFKTTKKKVTALFAPKQPPPPAEPRQTSEEAYATELREGASANLILIPGRPNRLWHGQPSQRAIDRAERKMLRKMSPRSRERRSVTAESNRKLLELEEERIAVRDF